MKDFNETINGYGYEDSKPDKDDSGCGCLLFLIVFISIIVYLISLIC